MAGWGVASRSVPVSTRLTPPTSAAIPAVMPAAHTANVVDIVVLSTWGGAVAAALGKPSPVTLGSPEAQGNRLAM
jgi:hypothetical protein